MTQPNIYLETLEFLPLKTALDAAYKAGVSSGFNDRDQYTRELEDRIAELEAQLAERALVKDSLTAQPETPPDTIEGIEEASHA